MTLTCTTGEARLVRGEVGCRRYQFVDGPRLYEDVWDPRNDGETLVVAPTRWTEPKGEATPPGVRDDVIASFWSFAIAEGDVTLLLEWRPDLDCRVIARWTRRDGWLVHIGSRTIEYLEPGRTLVVPYTRGTPANPTAEIAHPAGQSEARWRFPDDRAPSDDEWRAVRERLSSATSDDMVLTGSSWRIA